MTDSLKRIVSEIDSLEDIEKLQLVDVILADLDKPDPEIDKIWAEEARHRWNDYKAGKVKAIPYEDVLSKYKKK